MARTSCALVCALLCPLLASADLVSGPYDVSNGAFVNQGSTSINNGTPVTLCNSDFSSLTNDRQFFQFRISESGGDPSINLQLDFFFDFDGDSIKNGSDLDLMGDINNPTFNAGGPSTQTFEWEFSVTAEKASSFFVNGTSQFCVSILESNGDDGVERAKLTAVSAIPEPSSFAFLSFVVAICSGGLFGTKYFAVR